MRFILITYFFSIVAFSFAQEKDSLYNLGLEAISLKKYDLAEDYFIQNIEASPSFEAYYNLGYVYAKKEDWNKSLWANEAALKYEPTNGKAIYNAKFSLNHISPDATWSHPYSWTKRIIFSVGETTWFVLMLISSFVAAVSIYFLVSIKKRSSKKLWSKRLIMPFLILLVISVYCFNQVLDHYDASRFAYTTAKETVLYLSPDGLKVDEKLPMHLRLNIIQDLNDWAQVVAPDLRTYWVMKEDLLVY